MKTLSLIIGKGEVGMALHRILSAKYKVEIRDIITSKKIGDSKQSRFQILHVCFPYSKNFVKAVKQYQKQYKPKYTIIHSTVPVGTSKKCGAYHSPIRGIHPKLAQSIKIFTKYLAPKNQWLKSYFEKAKIKIRLVGKTEETEALKLWSTTQYGLNIILQKEIHQYCKKKKLDFNIIYTEANLTYNAGYRDLGCPQFKRYVLNHKKGAIGGHCIIPNCKLLKNKITKQILEANKKLSTNK